MKFSTLAGVYHKLHMARKDMRYKKRYKRRCKIIINGLYKDEPADFLDLVEFFWPHQSDIPIQIITSNQIKHQICKQLNVPYEVWDHTCKGKDLPHLLSLESPYPVDFTSEFSLSEIKAIMSNWNKEDSILEMCTKLNREEAFFFWSRMLGIRAPITARQFVLFFASGKCDYHKVKHGFNVMPISEVLHRIISHIPMPTYDVVSPCVPFAPAYYSGWSKSTLPPDVYIDMVRGPRQFLHISDGHGHLYNRDRKLMTSDISIGIEGNHIFEVEVGNELLITDYLYSDEKPQLKNDSYIDRLSYVGNMLQEMKVITPRTPKNGETANLLLEQCEPDTQVRLVSHGAYPIGDIGGWLLIKNAFSFYLLLMTVVKEKDDTYHITLGAVDGDEPFIIYEGPISSTVAYHIHRRIEKKILHEEIDLLDEAIVAHIEGIELDRDNMRLKRINFIGVNDDLGLSDVTQMVDVIESM
jgi:hypothetical protein